MFSHLSMLKIYIGQELKCILKAGNSCYYLVKPLWSSRLLAKNLKIKIYKTIILPVVERNAGLGYLKQDPEANN